MKRRYLLDTNILSHLVRRPQGIVAEHIAEVGEANVLTSVIVACELRYGVAKRDARALGAVCVTDNVSEFKRVPALKVENWLR